MEVYEFNFLKNEALNESKKKKKNYFIFSLFFHKDIILSTVYIEQPFFSIEGNVIQLSDW